MTLEEFSTEFDVLYNSITSNAAPGFNDYEKSVLLTLAQEELIKSYFVANNNTTGVGLDGSQKRHYDFSTLIKIKSLKHIVFYDTITTKVDIPLLNNDANTLFLIPNDVFLILNEHLIAKDNNYIVFPISYDTYNLLMSKPFPYPNKRQAWRLDSSIDGEVAALKVIHVSDDKDISSKNITFESIYHKPLNIEINIKNGNVLNDFVVVRESNEAVDITLNLSNTVNNGMVNISNYMYRLMDANTLKKKGLSKYIKPLNSDGIITSVGKVGTYKAEIPAVTDLQGNYKTFGVFNIIYYPKETPLDVSYTIRYVKVPRPIILSDLTDLELSIRNRREQSTCELPDEMHPEILKRAVELAKAYYLGDLQSQLAIGKNSSTELGKLIQQ
jgi:hypothetical protein